MERKEFVWMLRAVLVCALLAGVLLAFMFAPAVGVNFREALPECAWMYWPCLIFIWVLFALYFLGAGLGWKVVSEIGADRSFTNENAKRLMLIAKLALADTVLIVLGTLVLLSMNMLHPGIMLLLAAITVGGLTVTAVFASLSHLTKKAAGLQSDSDLTV